MSSNFIFRGGVWKIVNKKRSSNFPVTPLEQGEDFEKKISEKQKEVEDSKYSPSDNKKRKSKEIPQTTPKRNEKKEHTNTRNKKTSQTETGSKKTDTIH